MQLYGKHIHYLLVASKASFIRTRSLDGLHCIRHICRFCDKMDVHNMDCIIIIFGMSLYYILRFITLNDIKHYCFLIRRLVVLCLLFIHPISECIYVTFFKTYHSYAPIYVGWLLSQSLHCSWFSSLTLIQLERRCDSHRVSTLYNTPSPLKNAFWAIWQDDALDWMVFPLPVLYGVQDHTHKRWFFCLQSKGGVILEEGCLVRSAAISATCTSLQLS